MVLAYCPDAKQQTMTKSPLTAGAIQHIYQSAYYSDYLALRDSPAARWKAGKVALRSPVTLQVLDMWDAGYDGAKGVRVWDGVHMIDAILGDTCASPHTMKSLENDGPRPRAWTIEVSKVWSYVLQDAPPYLDDNRGMAMTRAVYLQSVALREEIPNTIFGTRTAT